jgi:hypothetical protein
VIELKFEVGVLLEWAYRNILEGGGISFTTLFVLRLGLGHM